MLGTERGWGREVLSGDGGPVLGDEKFWRPVAGRVAQQCDRT